VVDRVTFHNPDTGWSVLRVFPFDTPLQQETVIVHQMKVFAGATMEFHGAWTVNPQYGRQFKAVEALEIKPASAAALEKYLGSGLIKGVGPKTAKKIVRHFTDRTLEIFEGHIERLIEVPGIAERKLRVISAAWAEHRAIRDVMMFLQSHGISTLFAVRIYKQYGDDAIACVRADPYRLAHDFYGIGFFSADRVALSIGVAADSPQRMMAAITHVLAASREFGHCYLTPGQIEVQVRELLGFEIGERLPLHLGQMRQKGLLMVREFAGPDGGRIIGYYSKSLYFDELYVARRIAARNAVRPVDGRRIERWLSLYGQNRKLSLAEEQAAAVSGIVRQPVSILTGGPGSGKTTTTLVLVRLLEAMGRRVILTAPTGRAAQRMMDVIGREAKTIHRLLEWKGGQFSRNERHPLDVDFLIVDETSMLDISLTAALLKAVPEHSQVLFIGDADQLPSVGAGNVLRDLIASGAVPCFRLHKIFRQAQQSSIIRHAHQINSGQLPRIESPFHTPGVWEDGSDCFFMDADEATQEQLGFIAKVRRHLEQRRDLAGGRPASDADPYTFRIDETAAPYETELAIPKKFRHVDLERLLQAQTPIDELLAVLRKVHPWSSLHYGLTASDVVRKLYMEWIPKYFGQGTEIQIISPMTRGSLGTQSLNSLIQESANPFHSGQAQLRLGERTLRVGDRVIHRRNNYDLGVFNGDIGVIREIDNQTLACTVSFFPDGRLVTYRREEIPDLDLAYAITIHKSQGSEFEAVIIPVLTQHFKMLFRNLIYTALTRARRLAVLVGTRRALAMAINNQDTTRRQTALQELLRAG
jgi:exodeoxyribonuclease V alpha subunit